jgi:hypothetical protein
MFTAVDLALKIPRVERFQVSQRLGNVALLLCLVGRILRADIVIFSPMAEALPCYALQIAQITRVRACRPEVVVRKGVASIDALLSADQK